MATPPTEFGKRKPVVASPTPTPPVKRSHHVALLMMGTMAVGGGAYALMPRENCQPASPSAMAGPSPPISGTTIQPSPTPATTCGSRWGGGHGGSGSWWSHSSYYSGSSSSGTSTGAGSTTTARGGFGSFAHLFSGGG
ncbi:hypothetical protein [Bradyrhizobium erythrophlei]|jgi:hypothetical protein|uniref:Uncharacterized protein n=1 Tax=Bradyrhizobium erythrophlei TaxID=1437360 RepID=A0A1M7U8M5_9BRAD|nr:hypothetical protein [Bradyrhizobium erythrophlei]SHN79210.1 hypothetical protein SAMN05444170_3949 [Bradyrhizobium erythrophlei]